MKYLILMVILLAAGCDGSGNQPTEDERRTALFVRFQEFADRQYPGWSVGGLRNDESTFGGDASERSHYYVVLTKDKRERIVFLIDAQFELPDGKKVAKIYAPAVKPVDRIEDLTEDRQDEPDIP